MATPVSNTVMRPDDAANEGRPRLLMHGRQTVSIVEDLGGHKRIWKN